MRLRQAAVVDQDISLDKESQPYKQFIQQANQAVKHVNEFGQSGKTALYLALEKKHFNKALVLLKEFKADPNAGDPKKSEVNTMVLARKITNELPKELRILLFGDPGLQLRKSAAEGGDISLDEKSSSYQEFVRQVKEAKELINDSGKSNKTALYYAIEKKHFNKALVLLKEFMADPKAGVNIFELAERLVADMPNELATLLLAPQLWEAIEKGETERVKKLIVKVDVNFPHPVSGRTAVHLSLYLLALNMGNAARIEIAALIDHCKADKEKRDKLGFTPGELFARPHEFNPNLIEPATERQERLQLQRIYIAEANRLLKEHNMIIVPIIDLREIEIFLRQPQHSHYNKIMFVVARPNSVHNLMKPEKHVSPVYFERQGREEYFVQIDSMADIYPIPATKVPKIKQTVISSPFRRQRGGAGCIEDLIVISLKIAAEKDFIRFCLSNSDKAAMTNPLTSEERRYLFANQDKYNTRDLSYEEELGFLTTKGGARCLFQDITKGQLSPFSQEPISKCYLLTKLPDCLLLNVEIYKVVGYLIKIQPRSFTPAMRDLFLQQGHRDDKKQNFAGVEFVKRHVQWTTSKYIGFQGFFAHIFPRASSEDIVRCKELANPICENTHEIGSIVFEYAEEKDDLRPNFKL